MENHNFIKISSTNCRGLGDYSKRKDVFGYLRNKRIGIYCLQDTHFTAALEPYIRSEWGGEVYLNSLHLTREEFVYYSAIPSHIKYLGLKKMKGAIC